MARLPKYRRHSSGQAYIEYRTQRYYLGLFNSPESLALYQRTISEITAGQRPSICDPAPLPLPRTRPVTVAELVLAYWQKVISVRYLKTLPQRWQPAGAPAQVEPTSEQHLHRLAFRYLRKLHGKTLVREFGPKALAEVRTAMIKAGWVRSQINRHVARITRMFRWAVSQEIVDESVWTRLKSLWGLRRGEARESQPVLPVEQERIEGIREACSPTLWAMIQVQLLTGARPGEICSMRQGELSMQGEIWEYRPSSWKTQQYGGQKVILLGPKAQEAIRPFLRTSIEAFLFSPIESKQWHNARRRSARKSKVQPSQVSRRKPGPNKKGPLDHFETGSYGQAIKRACRKAGILPWHPHQLRHSAGTEIRQKCGVEAARTVLGHSSIKTTEIYAERDLQKAAEVMRQLG